MMEKEKKIMLERKYRLIDANKEFGFPEGSKRISRIAQQMDKHIYGFGDAGMKNRYYNRKELIICKYIMNRMLIKIKREDAVKEAVQLFYISAVMKYSQE